MTLSIIIVSWNTRELLYDCLNAVYTYPPRCEYEVWVVDNASHDDSVAMVRQHFPQARLIENEENVGFAAANNQAIARSEAEYVLLLNPDTEVMPDALQALVNFMEEHPEAGAAGSRLLNPDGSLQPSCHPMPTLSRELWRMFHLDLIYPHGRYRMNRWATDTPRRVDVIQGASLLLRRDVLTGIGMMDDNYFMYSEEVDLCYQLQQAGWPIYWAPASQVVHYGGQSTRQVATKMFIQLYRGKVQFFRKHYGPVSVEGYKLILGLAAIARLAAAPPAWLIQPQRRERISQLARHYIRLLRQLPQM